LFHTAEIYSKVKHSAALANSILCWTR